jgi:hypothetical protein
MNGKSEKGLDDSMASRVARFFLAQHNKTGKMYQKDHILYQMAINVRNGSKIDKCKWTKKLPTTFIAKFT